jgi:hypothetical protein
MMNCCSTQVMGNFEKCIFTETDGPNWNTFLSEDVNVVVEISTVFNGYISQN